MPSNNRPYSIFTFLKPRPKKVVLLSEIGWMKFFLSLTRPHCPNCIRIYIFVSKKKKEKKKHRHTNKQKGKEPKKD